MCLRVCHGILGDELFNLQEVDQGRFGWDLMTRTAGVLQLCSPFQVVIYAQDTSMIHGPLQALRTNPEMCETTFCYIVQSLQAPTACDTQDLIEAISSRDVYKLSHRLSKGIDLRGPDTEIGPISTILAAAILADYSLAQCSDLMNSCPILAHGTKLTYLLLQSLANPNVLPRLEQPTTMLELAVELGNSRIVQTLLEASASVVPIYGALPPLLIAVLHRDKPTVQLLLGAHADPWERVPIGHLHRYSLQWHPHTARKEEFTVVQAAAAQERCDTVLGLLLQSAKCPAEKGEIPPQEVAMCATALSERATTILQHTVWTFQHVINRQEPRTDFTTLRWRIILQGIRLPARSQSQAVAGHQDEDDGIPWDLLSQVD